MSLEASITRTIIAKLKQRIEYPFVMKLKGSTMQRRGMPDLMVIIDGRVFFFEVKQPGKDAKELQRHRMAQLRRAGAVAEVVTCWEDVLILLEDPT